MVALFWQFHHFMFPVPAEAAVFLREHLNSWYTLESYYVSKVVANLPLQLLCPTLFVLVAYFMTGQPFQAADRLAMLWLVCLLMAILADSLGLAVGAASSIQVGSNLEISPSNTHTLLNGHWT